MMGETMKLIFGADPCEVRENTSCFRMFPIDIGDKKKAWSWRAACFKK